MIPNGEGRNYLAVKKLSALLRGITSKNNGEFYSLNCLQSFRTIELESYIKVCKNKNFCNEIMPSEDTTILEFNQYQKSDKAQLMICVDLEYLIEMVDGCKSNLKIHSQKK